MTRSITQNKFKRALGALAAVIFWIAAWQLAYLKVAQELLLVSPAQAFLCLLRLSGELSFWASIGWTGLRVLTGFLLALLTGTLIAVLSARYGWIRALVLPLFGVIRATPVASFIILVLLWISTDRLPVFISFLMVIPMIWQNISAGISVADKNLLEMAKVFKLSRKKILTSIYFPAVTPHFISACSEGLGFAWKSAIAAEVICLPKMAVGRQIYNSKIYLETADLFAWTIAVIILSMLLEKLAIGGLKRLSKKIFAAYSGEGGNA